MTYEEFLKHFETKKRYQDRAQCICPSHSDTHASLTVTRGQRGTLIKCHAGCSTDDILQAVGLKKSDLFYEERSFKSNWKKYVECRENLKIEEIYNYAYFDGNYAYTKIRLQGKKMLYGILENDRFSYGLKGKSRKNAMFGDIKSLNKAISEGKTVFIPEGEKDVNTLRRKGYTALTYGSVNDWQQAMAQLFEGANVVVLADNDLQGINVANRIERDLRGIAKNVKIIVLTPTISKGDISIFFANHIKEEFEILINGSNVEKAATEKSISESLNIENILSLLDCKIAYDKDGKEKSRKILQTVRNFEIILENDRRFAGKIKFDEFSQQTYLMGDVPWKIENNHRAVWGSYDDSALFSILQSDYGMNNRNDFFDAIKNVSMRNKFHPVRDTLNSLKWDGEEHILGLLPDYLGVEDTEYSYQVMRLWMLGAVARIFQPGIKFDYTMILQGKQGLGKSTFLQLLALNDTWFNDSLDSLDSDKAAQSLMGSWIIELAELKSLARTAGGVDSVKKFLSARQDKFRIPYERRADIFLRQSVFAGTTNKSDFLQDETGNRRFLIIQTGVNEPRKSLFEPSAMDDIKAAWAQAVHIWKKEKPKLLLPDSCREKAEELQKESTSDDGKVGIIAEYLEDKKRTCAIEIWAEALHESGRPQKWQASEINNIVLGFPDWKRMSSPAKFGQYGSQRGFQKCSLQTQDKDVTKQECSSLKDDCSQEFIQISDFELSKLPFD